MRYAKIILATVTIAVGAGGLLALLAGPLSAKAAETSTRRPPPYLSDLQRLTRDNDAFRRVVYTGAKSQLVVMAIPPGQDIGAEQHGKVEQLLFCVSGEAQATVDGKVSPFGPGDVLVVPPGTTHDVRNIGNTPLKLYTVYVPPNHIPGRVQQTKQDAQKDHADEQFGAHVE